MAKHMNSWKKPAGKNIWLSGRYIMRSRAPLAGAVGMQHPAGSFLHVPMDLNYPSAPVGFIPDFLRFAVTGAFPSWDKLPWKNR